MKYYNTNIILLKIKKNCLIFNILISENLWNITILILFLLLKKYIFCLIFIFIYLCIIINNIVAYLNIKYIILNA